MPDDRDEFDAAEGQPVDEADRRRRPSRPSAAATSLEERRRAIHEKAQHALGEMTAAATTS